jgi:topoisomerase-4 subunit A
MAKRSRKKKSPDREEDLVHDLRPVSGLYKNWFLDYASYVILERAVPAIEDGFKPVQRRIMHALKEMDDGRFNKVANVIGSTMQYHPHGDASIGDAIVNIGQKELLFDIQGNWGDVRTGDSAAAARYIEVRLSEFAKEVVYNNQTTQWQLSYDGRKREPVTLPVKFPLLLAAGVEGIAVGLSTKILPHNFRELIKASIEVLKGKSPKIFPDFPTGGTADFSEYNQGYKGSRVRIRAKIEAIDKKTLIIKDIPFGTTTTGLIDSIIKANDKGKIKVKQVIDNTAEHVEILVHLAAGQSPDVAIDALYAFTDCEYSVSPNACVIIDEKPRFLHVNEILKINTEKTVALLKQELQIRKEELQERILFSSLEKIFIEKRIYRNIEECETWDAVIKTIDKGLKPYKKQFYREITGEDIVKLTEIKIKRISRFDSFKADELMKKLEEELKETLYNLKNLTNFSIRYYENLLEKFGKGRERKTESKSFDVITATVVAATNQKLYVNRKDGFAGYGLRKDEFVSECSDLDDIIAMRSDAKFMVSRISEKTYMGKEIMQVAVFKKNDERMVYNAVYVDGKTGKSMVKRFQVIGVTRDKEYDISKGAPGSKLLYISANPNGEAEVITVKLTQGSKARKKVFDFNFSQLDIKGRGAGGNIITRYPVRKIERKTTGVSTLKGLDIWYDESVGRLNREGRGKLVGNFDGDDRIIVFYKDGHYEITSYELSNRYEYDKVVEVAKLRSDVIITAVHYDGGSKNYYVKRFTVETSTLDKMFRFISEEPGSKLVLATTNPNPVAILEIEKGKGKTREAIQIDLTEVVDIKGWKAFGNRLSNYKIKNVKLAEAVKSGAELMEKPEEKPKLKKQKSQKKVKTKSVKSKTFSKKAKTNASKEKSIPGKPVIRKSKSTKKKGKINNQQDLFASQNSESFEVGSTIQLDL